MLAIEIIDNLFLILFMKGRRDDESCAGNNVEADEFLGKNSYRSVSFLLQNTLVFSVSEPSLILSVN
ncbi:hypothetical protein PREVCOP_03627 [Segatella copri DSM 18205]|uniref:Uncharacterized protein n=1 Tax=Segatella copri DSM 18205 TaxID=537011 RepID=D1P8X0_9BACT|nr:hypothetical protein PREVCOP_03627 [Segatella copri DSM 18205]